MRLLVVSLLTLVLVPGFVTEASAKKRKHVRYEKHVKHARPAKYARAYDSARAYPNASERQRRNSIAFDNGDYYESDFNAHAFGSRSWWMLQQGRGGRR